MSTVEQIHHLETHVERILVLVRDLRSANASLREEVAASEERSAELQSRLSASERAREESDRKRQDLEERLSHLRSEQEEIAATINRTLEQLGRQLGGTEESSEAVPQMDEPKLFDAADESEAARGEAASDEAQSDGSDKPGTEEADAEEGNPEQGNTEHSEGSEFDIF